MPGSGVRDLLGTDMVLDAAVREVVNNKRSRDSSNSSLHDLERMRPRFSMWRSRLIHGKT